MKFAHMILMSAILCMRTIVGFNEDYDMHSAFDRLYPITNFKRVEIICRELWFDLDFLHDNQELQKKIASNSHYLVNQFLLLEKYLERMVNDSRESISYLLEDIDYLAEMIDAFETKYNELHVHLLGTGDQGDHIKSSIIQSLEKSKDCVEKLFLNNKEVRG